MLLNPLPCISPSKHYGKQHQQTLIKKILNKLIDSHITNLLHIRPNDYGSYMYIPSTGETEGGQVGDMRQNWAPLEHFVGALSETMLVLKHGLAKCI